MDKILRRVRMAEGQVARRIKRQAVSKSIQNKKARLDSSLHKEASHSLKAARAHRAEDWKLGPLAPRRDFLEDPYGNKWGSLSHSRAMVHAPITPEERRARSAWCGGTKCICLRQGDRVVVIDGPYKDKIGVIESLDKKYMTVTIGNIRTNITVPDYMNTGQESVQVVTANVPISSVRLIHPLPDAKTGKVRDVIIREIRPINIIHDRPTREVTYDRLVTGANVTIPWPKEEPVKHEDWPVDTLRIAVEERTFVPTLLRPPMPETVIHELRNQYSKFRTRHTPEYIAKKEAEEAEKKAKKTSVASMRLPVQEFNIKQRELRKARGQPELTPEMLEKIGQVIARNMEMRGTIVETKSESSELSSEIPPPETSAPEDQPRV
ncbi:hypothetical protein B0H66DRAFT_341804 [Apodospora peruviana]|uniref:KOW domain-containing protein n=1 Tax=Apodospora peruviana TaxID=516989 RepID=A0AAE0HZE8_9PEZI|nr:hypothetical protein B0H66DRAFT_341804 [Apodospora peruviana]